MRRQGRGSETPTENIEEYLGSYETSFDTEFDPDLVHAIGNLNRDQREALTLRYSWDLSCKEVAKHIGRSESATRVMLHRSLKEIREKLIVHISEDEDLFIPNGSK